METKTSIRKLVYARRKAADPREIQNWSDRIRKQVLALPEFTSARWIYTYIDYKNEVMTGKLIEEAWKLGKRVASPKVEGKDMVFYEISGWEDLCSGYMGIREPKEGLPPVRQEQALMIMPGVAFDSHRHRLGYGGGFYDRYLAAYRGITTAALAFEFQMFPEVPREATDILPDYLITEKGIY